MKKLLALTLSLLMVFTTIPMAIISASAEETVWKTMYDWEDGSTTGAKVVTVNDNKVSIVNITSTYNTNIKNPIATTLVSSSTRAILVNGGYSPNTMVNKSYASFLMTDDFKKNGTALRIAYRVGRSGDKNMAFTGVTVGGVAYFKSEAKNYSYVWYNPVGKTYTTPDGESSITITNENVNKIEAFNVACTSGYVPECSTVDDIQYNVKNPVTMKSGAAIRLGDVNGIRFYTTVDTEKLAELKKVEGNVVELGTLIAPADLVTGELTHEIGEANYVDVKYQNDEWFEENTFVGSIVNIQDRNIGRKFIGRGYVKVTNGEKVTYYYATQNDNERSLKSVAASYQGTDDYNLKSQEIKDLVDNWASAADWSAQ